MKIRYFLIALVLGTFTLQSCGEKKEAKKDKASMSENDRVSYCLGMSIAKNIKTGGLDTVNSELLAQGVKDFYSKDSSTYSDKQAGELLNQYFQKLQAKKSEKLKMDGEKFLAENKSKEGVKVTASGLQYIVEKEGNGPIPKLTDNVKTHYTGYLIDGSVFDSSVERGQPAVFPVNGVIPGWTEILQLMKVGSKYKIFVPWNLAYGERGAGGKIGPYATLIFEMELLSIEKPTKEDAKAKIKVKGK
jgi:FKBP-type peptidyl-prolyl cis-trans isomerase FklB